MLHLRKDPKSFLLIALLAWLGPLVLANTGYPVQVSVSLRNCDNEQDPLCTTYAFKTMVYWSEEDHLQAVSDLEIYLQGELKDKLEHWVYLRSEEIEGQNVPISIRADLVEEHAGDAKTILDLRLISPLHPDKEISLGRIDVYPSAYFITNSLLSVDVEKKTPHDLPRRVFG